jgi:LmbE family N-acetylglucosaminyl deacetylase
MRSSPTIPSLGTILGVWAHPDDEAYLSAGLMTLARRHGSRVVVVTATNGERGTPDPDRWPPARLGAVRRREMAASLALLGVDEHHWLDLPDGGCADLGPDEGARLVGRLVADVRPDTIVTFGPEGMTGHPDHRAVSAWTTAARMLAAPQARLWYATVTEQFHAAWGTVNDTLGIWSEIDQPPCTRVDSVALSLELDGTLTEQKLAALRAHASQTAGLIAELGEDVMRRWWATESFVDARHHLSTACVKRSRAWSAHAGRDPGR